MNSTSITFKNIANIIIKINRLISSENETFERVHLLAQDKTIKI